MGKIAATCKVRMARRMLTDILDDTQFETLHVADNASDAKHYAMDHLNHQATLHGLQRHWSIGKRIGPPTVRNVSKNILNELHGWRVRPQCFCLDLIPVLVWRFVVRPFTHDLDLVAL